MTTSRRSFLVGASVSAVVASTPTSSSLSGTPSKSARSVLGAFGINSFAYMNFAKQAGSISAGTTAYPGNLSNDGYPVSTPRTAISGNYPFPREYFGRQRIQFGGQGSFQLSPPTIVYNGGASIAGIGPSNAGSVYGNFAIIGRLNPGVFAPIEFAFGLLITGISDNGFGSVRLATKTLFAVGQLSTGQFCRLNNVAGVNPGVSYAITLITGSTTQFDLLELPYNSRMAVVGGGPGAQSEAILSYGQVSFQFPALGPYGAGATQMNNLIHCRKSDIDGTNPFGLQNGYQINADFISRIKTLNPKYVRLMDASAVINSTATNYRYRPRPTNFSYGATGWIPAYWAGGSGSSGAITNDGSDAYTCLNPSASGEGGYVDGEIVQGQIGSTSSNTGISPTLNVNSRGSAPIYDSGATLQRMTITGSVAPGDSFTFNFPGTNFKFTSKTASIDAFGANLVAAINADSTLAAAKLFASNSGKGNCSIIYNLNSGNGTSFAYSTSGATKITFGTVPAGFLANNTLVTFTYSAVLRGWITVNGGVNLGIPTEAACEIGNRASVGIWFNIPLLYTAASASALAAKVRDSLEANLSAVFELSNEIWNFSEYSTFQAQNIGACLGFAYGGLDSIHSFYGLRFCQLMEQVSTAWTVSRSRSQLMLTLAFQFFGRPDTNADANVFRFKGTSISTSGNRTYAAFGNLEGKSTFRNYNAFPTRPIDLADSVSYATYYNGAQLPPAPVNAGWAGLVTFHAVALQAGLDYAKGNILSAFAGLSKDLRSGNRNGSLGAFTLSSNNTQYLKWEALIATYDGARPLSRSNLAVLSYEGGFESGLGNTFVEATTPSDLAARMNALDWDVSPYTVSRTNNRIEAAQQMINLLKGYKSSSVFQADVTLQMNQQVAAHAGRVCLPAWFLFDGPSIWAMYPGDIYTTPYASFNAIQEWNR